MTEIECRDRISNDEIPLELSIEKWERIKQWLETFGLTNVGQLKVKAITFDDYSSKTCALCHTYTQWITSQYIGEDEKDCENCPVTITTGMEGCENTPFNKFEYAVESNNTKEAIKLADEFVKILKSCRSDNE
tara:strand:- start:1002 stop:1400 length:399 start_codon:yes stop_codon:yes gene_type:complete